MRRVNPLWRAIRIIVLVAVVFAMLPATAFAESKSPPEPPAPPMPNLAQDFPDLYLQQADCDQPGIVHNRTTYSIWIIGSKDGRHVMRRLPAGRSSTATDLCDVDLFTMGVWYRYFPAYPPWEVGDKPPWWWSRIVSSTGVNGYTVTCRNFWAGLTQVWCQGQSGVHHSALDISAFVVE